MTTNASTQAFVAGNLPSMSPGTAEDPLNFVDLVVKRLHHWAAAYPGAAHLDTPAYCCFVLCDRVAKIADALPEFKARPYFRDDTPQDMLGHIYLCSFTLQTVFSREFSGSNIDDLIREVGGLGLATRPLVIYNSANKRALWRVSNETDFTAVEVGGNLKRQLRSRDFDKELQRFHLKYTSTPQGWAMPWKDPKKLQTKDNLEVEIRNWLCVALRLTYEDSLSVSIEHQEPTGRADLKVLFIAERVPYFLELKVFRKVRPVKGKLTSVSNAATIKWGKEGVTQAHLYLQANDDFGVAYACCYDARGKDEEVEEVKEYAESKKVRYRRYFMFPSAPALHKAVMSLKP
jgi:hypothetical protein